MQEKWVTIMYGDGTGKRIPESVIPKAQESAAYMMELAKRPGSGYTPEQAEQMYTLRIVRDEDNNEMKEQLIHEYQNETSKRGAPYQTGKNIYLTAHPNIQVMVSWLKENPQASVAEMRAKALEIGESDMPDPEV